MSIDLRLLAHSELPRSYEIMAELRTALSQEEYLRRVSLQMEAGYRLVGAFSPDLVGLVGFRPVRTLARGWHMHVDDLIITSAFRKGGIGAALLKFVEEEAKRNDMSFVFLDSVPGAVDFYMKGGYVVHGAALVKKKI